MQIIDGGGKNIEILMESLIYLGNSSIFKKYCKGSTTSVISLGKGGAVSSSSKNKWIWETQQKVDYLGKTDMWQYYCGAIILYRLKVI